MAVLSAADRKAIRDAWMRDNESPLGALTKADLQAAFNAIDQWTEDNQASFNSAIPQPARGVLTAKQKADLLLYVVRRRFETTNGG